MLFKLCCREELALILNLKLFYSNKWYGLWKEYGIIYRDYKIICYLNLVKYSKYMLDYYFVY